MERSCPGHEQDLTGNTIESPNGLVLEVTKREPATPIVGDQAWTVKISDGSTPLVGAADRITVTPYMPDHGHGSAIGVDVTEAADGRYLFSPINLRMPGYWDISVRLATGDAGVDRAKFGICVE
jgi:hypothetical protein